MNQHYCLWITSTSSFMQVNSQRVKVALPPPWDPQAAVWFFVQCILFQHLTSVICIKWSVFIYLCIVNNCLLWHQRSQLYKNKVWWTSSLSTLMHSKLICARRLIITRKSASCYMLNWAKLTKEGVIFTSVIKMLIRSKVAAELYVCNCFEFSNNQSQLCQWTYLSPSESYMFVNQSTRHMHTTIN